jgi:predicted dehydrogenase
MACGANSRSAPRAWNDQPNLTRPRACGGYRFAHAIQLSDFAAACAGHGEPLVGPREILDQSRVLEALLISAQEGRPVAT